MTSNQTVTTVTTVTNQRRPGGPVPRAVERRGGELLSIGAVLAFLRDDFPEVTISKIRFLEAEGLVEPQRTPSGYRKFGPADVERLAYVLRMQRDHYLPLRVIREHLDAIERGEQPPALPAADARPGPLEEADRELVAASGQAPGYGWAGPSCWQRPVPRSATWPSGSPTGWSCRDRMAATTRRPCRSPGWWPSWAGSAWNPATCAR